MRLSFTKTLTIMFCAALCFAVAAVCFTLSPPRAALAETDFDIPLTGVGNQPKQYGDLFNSVDAATGRIYGAIQNDVFKAGSGSEYYVLAKDIMVCSSAMRPSATYEPSLKQLTDVNGYVQVDVLPDYDPEDNSTGKYYLTYDGAEGYTFFSKLQVYVSANEMPHVVGSKSYKVAYYGIGDLLYCQVTPRCLTVAYDAASSHTGGGMAGDALTTEEVGGVLYVDHTYGALPDSIAFSTQGEVGVMEAFGDRLTTSTTFEGNDRTAHVGLYEIESLDLKVKRDDKDVSGNYRFASAREGADGALYTGYGVRVLPRAVEIGEFMHEGTFGTTRDTYADLYDGNALSSGTFTSQGFSRTYQSAQTGVNGQTLTVYYDVDLSQPDLWDVDDQDDPREGVVAITAPGDSWAVVIVGWSAANTDPDAAYDVRASDYVVRAAAGASLTLTVGKRAIVLYEAKEGVPAPDNGVDVVANHIEISKPYGDVYTGAKENHGIVIDDIPVTLSFEVEYAGQSLADYLAAEGLESIRLPAGEYRIINPEVTDKHYVVTIDESAKKWTVTKKVVGSAQLVAWGLADGAYLAENRAGASASAKAMYAFLSAAELPTDGICLHEYAYDGTRKSVSLSYAFTDADIGGEVAADLTFVNAEDAVMSPGYYALAYTHADYAMPAGTVYVRVLPVAVTVTAPTDAVYNGERYGVTLRYDGEENNPFGGWSVALTYRDGQRTTTPLNAGTYTAAVSVVGPEAQSANPYLVYNGSNVRFTVSPKAITVRLKSTAQLTKTFGDEVGKRKLTFSVDDDALVGSDSISLFTDGLDADAAPGAYAVEVVFDHGERTNYDVELLDAGGRRDPRFTVEKIAVDDVRDYFNDFLQTMQVVTTTDAITLSEIRYYGVAIDGVAYQYGTADGGWTNTPAEMTALEDGAKYRVRIVIRADGTFIATDTDVYTEVREIITDIAVPTLRQDFSLTSGRSVCVDVTNFDRTKTYACVMYDADQSTVPVNVAEKAVGTPDAKGSFTIARAYNFKEDAAEPTLDQLASLDVGHAYKVVVVVSTADASVMSAPLSVRTRSQAPAIAPSSMTVTDKSISVPEGYYIYVAETENTGALPVSSIVETTMQKEGLTYQMLAEAGAELTEEYLAAVTEDLRPNTTYVIAIWSMEEGDDMASDVQCFTFRTLIDKSNRFSYSGVMLAFSRYLLVGLLGLVLILFIICTIRYAVLKKKLSGGNR